MAEVRVSTTRLIDNLATIEDLAPRVDVCPAHVLHPPRDLLPPLPPPIALRGAPRRPAPLHISAEVKPRRGVAPRPLLLSAFRREPAYRRRWKLDRRPSPVCRRRCQQSRIRLQRKIKGRLNAVRTLGGSRQLQRRWWRTYCNRRRADISPIPPTAPLGRPSKRRHRRRPDRPRHRQPRGARGTLFVRECREVGFSDIQPLQTSTMKAGRG